MEYMTLSYIGEENPPKQNISSSKQFCPSDQPPFSPLLQHREILCREGHFGGKLLRCTDLKPLRVSNLLRRF